MASVLPKFPRSRISPQRRLNRRTEPALGLRLLSLQPGLEPNELLEIEYCVRRVSALDVDQLEVSVMWYTEGKGCGDFGVHFFQSLSDAELNSVVNDQPGQVSVRLPASPLSYEGKMLKIRWCVRLCLYLKDGRKITTEQPFYLGNLTVEV